jgi:hypothetical protein
VRNLAQKKQPGGGDHAGETGRGGGGGERSNVRNSVWQFGTGNRKC